MQSKIENCAISTPLVSIIILNWNGAQFLKECLDSVLHTQYSNIEILLVDNASTDGSEQIAYAYKNVRVVINPQNLGYAGGNNAGIRLAKGEYIVALNNDIVVEPDWLNKPITIMESDKRIGIAGCRQMQRKDSTIIDGLFLTVRRDLGTKAIGANQKWDSKFSSMGPGFVMGVNGGSAIYRRSFLDETRGFDEHFFGYYEDADLCFQAFLNGWKALYVPSSVVYHLGSASFKKNLYNYYYLLERNRLLFIYKNFPLSCILKQSFFILTYEIRNLRGTVFGLKFPTLYYKSRIDALRKFHQFKHERKINTAKFKKRQKYYEILSREKIINIKTDH